MSLSHTIDGVVKHDGSFIQSPNFELGYAACKVHRKTRHTIDSGWRNAPPHFEPIQTCSESVSGLRNRGTESGSYPLQGVHQSYTLIAGAC